MANNFAACLRTPPQKSTRAATPGRKPPIPKFNSVKSPPQGQRNSLSSPDAARKRSVLGKDENIQVMVALRVRGFLPRENNSELAVHMKDKTLQITTTSGEKKLFTFDHCLWSNDSITCESPYADQQQVYQILGAQLVDNAFKGFNSTIFAYGQTGSGKTYSMYGDGTGDPETEGMIPRVCKALFEHIEAAKDEGENVTYKVHVSMIEVYLENVFDLLNNKERLAIRGSLETGFYVPGLRKFEVKDYSGIAQLVQRGQAHRVTAAHELNDSSSRAHALFEIHVKQVTPDKTLASKISLVDLAGSERVKDSKVDGLNFTQTCAINKSLLNLGNCMEAIVERAKNPHRQIPFRDSALTKLLKESLGGNARTILLVTASPTLVDSTQTLVALRFADRAKQIKTHAVINEDALQDAKEMSKLVQEQYAARLKRLQDEMEMDLRQAQIHEKEVELEQEALRIKEEKEQLHAERESSNQLTTAKRKELEEREQQLEEQYRLVLQTQQETLKQRDEMNDEASRIMAEHNERKRKKQEEEEERVLTLEKLKTLQEDHELLQQKIEANEAAFQQQREALQTKLEQMAQAAEAKDAEWRALELSTKAHYEGELERLQAGEREKQDQLTQECEERVLGLQAEALEVQARLQQHIAELESSMKQYTADLDGVGQEVETLKTELQQQKEAHAALRVEHEKEKEELVAAHDRTVAETKQCQERELKHVQSTSSAQMGQLQAEHAAETQLMAEAHSTQISQLRNANQQSAAEETARLEAQHKTYVATLQEAMEDRVRTLQLQLETEHVAGQTAKDGYKREVAQLRGEVESAQNALLQAKEQYKADLQNLQSKLEQDADTTKHEAKERHRREVVELEHALQEAEEAHKKQVVALRQQLQTAHERELAALQDDHRKEREALREQLEGAAEVKTRQELKALRKQLESTHEDRVQAVMQAHVHELELLKKERDERMAQLVASHEEETSQMLQAHKEQLLRSEQELRDAHNSLMMHQTQRQTENIVKVQDEMTSQIQETVRKHNAELEQLRADSSAREVALRKQLELKEQSLQEAIASNAEEAQRLKADFLHQKSLLDSEVEDLRGSSSAREDALTQQITRLEEQHRRVVGESAEECRRLTAEFAQKHKALTDKIEELETSLGEKNAEMTEWGEQQQKLADLIGKASLLLGPKRARSDLSFSLSPSGSLRRGDSLSGHTPGARSPGNDKLADISNLGPREVAGKGHAAPEAFYAPRLTSGP